MSIPKKLFPSQTLAFLKIPQNLIRLQPAIFFASEIQWPLIGGKKVDGPFFQVKKHHLSTNGTWNPPKKNWCDLFGSINISFSNVFSDGLTWLHRFRCSIILEVLVLVTLALGTGACVPTKSWYEKMPRKTPHFSPPQLTYQK